VYINTPIYIVRRHIALCDILVLIVWNEDQPRLYINYIIYNAWTIISSITGENEDQETTQMENMCVCQ